MKIKCINLLLIVGLSWACKTSSETRISHQQNTYSNKISLANVDFSDGTLYWTGSMEGHSYNYKFGVTSYQKFVYVHYTEPYHTHLLESGEYEINEQILTLKPKIKMWCKLENFMETIDCRSNGDWSNGY